MISKRLTGSAFLAGLFVILALALAVSVLPPAAGLFQAVMTVPAAGAGIATLSGEESSLPPLATLSGEESAPPKRG
jgi:hypothetical protein